MAGVWLDEDRCLGFEVGGFILQPLTDRFTFNSNGSVPLYRPIFGTDTQREGIQVVATPFAAQGGPIAGNFQASLSSSFWGAEANVRSCLLCNCNFFLDGLVGFRTLGLNETLDILETPTLTGTGAFRGVMLPTGTGFVVDDNFKTRNQFYGGQIGLISEVRNGPWSLNLSGKLAAGSTEQTAIITGSTQINTPGMAPQFFNSGILANSGTNGGTHSRSVFSIVPEVGVNLGYQMTQHIRLFVGYNLIYWTNVLRPGSQIDRVINPNLLPGAPAAVAGVGPARPTFVYNSSDFWAQGLTVGVVFRY